MAPRTATPILLEETPSGSRSVNYFYKLWMESMNNDHVVDGEEYLFKISSQGRRKFFEEGVAYVLKEVLDQILGSGGFSFTFQVDHEEKRLFLNVVMQEDDYTEDIYEMISEESISYMAQGRFFDDDFEIQGVAVVPNWSPL